MKKNSKKYYIQEKNLQVKSIIQLKKQVILIIIYPHKTYLKLSVIDFKILGKGKEKESFNRKSNYF